MSPQHAQAVPALRGRVATLHWPLLLQLLISVAPAMALVAAGSPRSGSRVFFLTMLVQLGYYLFTRNRLGFVALFVSSIPAAMMLRDYFMFNSVILILGLGLGLWLAVSYEEFSQIWRNRAFGVFLAFAFLYWWLSFLRTGSYFSNLRILELAFSAGSILLLGKYRSYLATALVGIGISAIAVGAGLSPYGDRLGMAEIGEASLGNPITLGLPAALILILSVAYKGRWLLADSRPVLRMALSMGVAATLLLSTSRGSWLVALVGFTILFIGARRRGSILLSLAPIAIAGMLALASGRGAFVTEYFERAVEPGRTMAQRTTGRARQWAALPMIFAGSPVWGYGPGSGEATNIRFTGIHKAWHSLYLQVAVEAGMIGLVLLVLLLAVLWWRGLRHWKMTRDLVPLIATLCFMTIVVSVSGLDAISGVYLGIAFLGCDLRNHFVLRQVAVPAPVAIAV